MNLLAHELNNIIQKESPVVYSLLSRKGKDVYFPRQGILAQSAQAAKKSINATIGTASADNGSPLGLEAVTSQVMISPQLSLLYAPSYGRPDIRAKWREMLYAKNSSLVGVEVSNPVVTNALTHGLSMAGYMFADPEDEIIVSDYCWDNYSLIYETGYGAKLTSFSLFNEGKFDLEGLTLALSGKSKKKILLLNFPNNPTGYTPTISEMKAIASIIEAAASMDNKIVVIIDDAYFGLVYEEEVATQSIFASLASLHSNVLAIKLDGPTKEDYVWGFRVGFITFGIKGGSPALYKALEDKLGGAIRGNISNAPNISQSILLRAYEHEDYLAQKEKAFHILKNRYLVVKMVLDQNLSYKDYFEALPFNSGYFMCITLKKGLEGEALRQKLLSDYDTGVIFISGVIRIAFSSVNETQIPKLFNNIYQACKQLSL